MATRQEQVIMHLYGLLGTGNGYSMPFGTTQDGIAAEIGTSRANASIILKRMQERNLVTCELRHIDRSEKTTRSLRKCYRLNPKAIFIAHELLKGVA